MRRLAWLPIMASCLLIPPALAVEASGAAAQSNGITRLELQARGVVQAMPDLVLISAGVVTQDVTANAAIQANAVRMDRVFAALRAAGIAEKDIRTQAITLVPQYRYAQNEAPAIIGYQASNTVSIRFRDIKKSGAVLDALVKQGANEINGPSFVIEDPAAAEDAARLDAMRQLRSRAALYAKATGMTVRRIAVLSEAAETGPAPVPYLMTRATMADAGLPKTAIAPGEQDIVVTVSATFELQ